MEDIFNNPFGIKVLSSLILAIVITVFAKIAISISQKNKERISESQYVIKYTAVFFFGIAMVVIWLDGIGPMLTALTIVAAALTIVAKEIILNFLGSFVIFWRELFAIGDRVQVGDHAGDVIDKGLLYFTLLELGQDQSTGHSTGRMIKIPNSLVHTLPIINATRGAGFIWNEMTFSVTRKSDWEKGKILLLEVANEYSRANSIDLEKVKRTFEKNKIYFNTLTPKVYISVGMFGVKLTLRYICRARLIRESEEFITTRFLHKLEPGLIELTEEQ
ncbi:MULTISPECIES: mechanosensitive ion channel domain-containing protein [unclassified Pseudodesulfovibrio]|uniref:mechanosensitive ion channel family protein n=1 Tax=unclassified Pseudodesulfovibrio TaxID=2661612 RepID=UPI000FEBC54F|nr:MULTISPECIES: mechanosensitive ion channel domain-containing protein [unclassified Pseudodesulfovibrio]MCJ2163927.1 mechanosensitive ion channel family protein [Pseudodesulfovibrio sp. S3-i]RWU05828.1 mechanosensitive ion channel protein MscS [Pseudodesulfovibrio sp. S3]